MYFVGGKEAINVKTACMLNMNIKIGKTLNNWCRMTRNEEKIEWEGEKKSKWQ